MMKKILVLGGTGAIGAHLVDYLKNTDYAVFVTSRKNREATGNINYVKGNAHDLCFLKQLLEERYVAIVNFMTYTTEEFEEVAPLLLEATDQYFFLSSCRTFANSDELLLETSPQLLDVCRDEDFLKTDNYALAKARQERLIINYKEKNWTIIRPYLTYSEQRLQLGFFEQNSWLLRAISGCTIVFSEDLSDKYTTLTYGKDVALAIFLLIGKERAMGETINITCGKSLRWKDVLTIYCDEIEKCLGRRVQVKIIHKAPINNYPTEKWTYLYDRVYNRRFSNEKLYSIVDGITFTPPEVGLRHCVREFIKKPNRNGYSSAEQAMFDRITGEYINIKEISSFRDLCTYFLYRYISRNKISIIKKILRYK